MPNPRGFNTVSSDSAQTILLRKLGIRYIRLAEGCGRGDQSDEIDDARL